jgi:hypothetical protein
MSTEQQRPEWLERDDHYRPHPPRAALSSIAGEMLSALPRLIAAFIGAVVETLTTPGMRTSEGLMALGLFGTAAYVHATGAAWPPDIVLLGIVAIYGFYALARAVSKSGRGGG